MAKHYSLTKEGSNMKMDWEWLTKANKSVRNEWL